MRLAFKSINEQLLTRCGFRRVPRRPFIWRLTVEKETDTEGIVTESYLQLLVPRPGEEAEGWDGEFHTVMTDRDGKKLSASSVAFARRYHTAMDVESLITSTSGHRPGLDFTELVS